MRYRIFTALLIIYSIALPISAQPRDLLKVEEVVLKALQQNLSLRIEGIQALNAKEEITIQETQFDTSLFASGSQRGTSTAGYNGFEGDSTHNSLVRAGISKNLNSGAEMQVTTNYARTSNTSSFLILNPAHASDLSISLRQPLMEGLGSNINLIPLKQAGIDAVRADLFLKESALRIMEVTESSYWDLAYAHEVK